MHVVFKQALFRSLSEPVGELERLWVWLLRYFHSKLLAHVVARGMSIAHAVARVPHAMP